MVHRHKVQYSWENGCKEMEMRQVGTPTETYVMIMNTDMLMTWYERKGCLAFTCSWMLWSKVGCRAVKVPSGRRKKPNRSRSVQYPSGIPSHTYNCHSFVFEP